MGNEGERRDGFKISSGNEWKQQRPVGGYSTEYSRMVEETLSPV